MSAPSTPCANVAVAPLYDLSGPLCSGTEPRRAVRLLRCLVGPHPGRDLSMRSALRSQRHELPDRGRHMMEEPRDHPSDPLVRSSGRSVSPRPELSYQYSIRLLHRRSFRVPSARPSFRVRSTSAAAPYMCSRKRPGVEVSCRTEHPRPVGLRERLRPGRGHRCGGSRRRRRRHHGRHRQFASWLTQASDSATPITTAPVMCATSSR